MRTSSDAERLAHTRLLIAFLVIYLLCVGFMALGDRLYLGTRYVIYTRLATIPFFLLLLRRWLLMVRVRPPAVLLEARQLLALNKPSAARDKFAEVARLGPQAARLDRARRLLQDGLAVSVEQEARIEQGRCSLLLGELQRATGSSELGGVYAELPTRADVAIDFAEALRRSGQEQRAAEVLRSAIPHMDQLDVESLREQPALLALAAGSPLPARSPVARRILLERLVAAGLICAAVVHAMHLYLGLF